MHNLHILKERKNIIVYVLKLATNIHAYIIIYQPWCSLLFFLQKPFNEVTFSLIGDDKAPSIFQINPKSGLITVSKPNDLQNDKSSSYKVNSLRVLNPSHL